MRKKYSLVAVVMMASAVMVSAQSKKLTLDMVGPGFCDQFPKTSPVAEYWNVSECSWNGENTLGRGQLKCERKGDYKKFHDMCGTKPLECNLVPDLLSGKSKIDYATMFERMLIVHDKEIVEKMIVAPKWNQYFAGACLKQEYFPQFEATLGLGIAGDKSQIGALDTLFANDWRVNNIVSGLAMRKNIADAYFWLGNKDGAKTMMKMLPISHIQRYPGREFREVSLSAMAEWQRDDAVDLCANNLRDIKVEGDLAACMLYLARLGKSGGMKSMIRHAERARHLGPVAIGMLGSKQAKSYLKDLKKEKGDGPAYFHIDFAQYLSGDKKAWKKMQDTLTARATPDKRALGMLGFVAGNAKLSKQVSKFLKKNEKKWKKERKEIYTLSVGVRAQLGDKKATAELGKLINDKDKSVRSMAVRAAGGDWGNVHSGMVGFGVVPDAALIKPLGQAHREEESKSLREQMARAMLNVRGAVRAREK